MTPLCSWSPTPSYAFHSPCCRTPLNAELLRSEGVRPRSLVTKSAAQPCLQALPSTAGASLENMVSNLVSCSACTPCVPSSNCIFLKSALKTTTPWLPAEDGLCFTLQHPQLILVTAVEAGQAGLQLSWQEIFLSPGMSQRCWSGQDSTSFDMAICPFTPCRAKTTLSSVHWSNALR